MPSAKAEAVAVIGRALMNRSRTCRQPRAQGTVGRCKLFSNRICQGPRTRAADLPQELAERHCIEFIVAGGETDSHVFFHVFFSPYGRIDCRTSSDRWLDLAQSFASFG